MVNTAPATPSQDFIPKRPEARSGIKPITWWALIGAVCVAFNIYVFSAWFISGDAYPTATGVDAVPTFTKAFAWFWQIVLPVGAVFLVVYLWRKSRREGRLTWDAYLMIPFLTCFWQDTFLNVLRPVFYWNSYMLNLGSWNGQIPGWISPYGRNIPEPLLFEPVLYLFWFSLAAIFFCAIARLVQKWRPNIGKVGIFIAGVTSIALIDVFLEVFWLRTGLFAYPATIEWLTIFPGTTYQFPVYEAVIVGLWSGTLGMLRLNRDDKGQSSIERGVDELPLSTRAKTGVRLLAFCGLANALFLAANVVYVVAGLYVSDSVPHPSYMTNEMCGPDTDVNCPGPETPIYLPNSPREQR